MEFNVTLKADDGRTVSMAAHQANAIQELNNTRKAGIASVTGYQPTTNWEVRPTQNIQLITHISVQSLYQRRLEALVDIEFKDVSQSLAGDEKLSRLTLRECIETFDDRKAKEIASIEKSLERWETGAPATDSHRAAHERCYAHFGNIKVHLKTDGGKPAMPVLDADGNVQLESIMVQYIELNVTTTTQGKRKTVNSGASVRMKNLIQKALNKRSTALKTLSLKADNFESFNIDGKELVAEDVARFGDLLTA